MGEIVPGLVFVPRHEANLGFASVPIPKLTPSFGQTLVLIPNLSLGLIFGLIAKGKSGLFNKYVRGVVSARITKPKSKLIPAAAHIGAHQRSWLSEEVLIARTFRA